MQFQVPQFIEVEAKIFGPFTIKQFIYLAGTVGATLGIYFTTNSLFITGIISAPIIVFGLALAFYKVNGKSFSFILEVATRYFINSKLYIWKKEQKPVVDTQSKIPGDKNNQSSIYVPKLADSRLRDLTWNLDITDNMKRKL